MLPVPSGESDTVGPVPSVEPTVHAPYSCRGSPATPSAAATRASDSCENTDAASNAHAVPVPASSDSPLPAVKTVRPPYQASLDVAAVSAAAPADDISRPAIGCSS